MPICKKCGEQFPSLSKDENGKRQDSRRRVYCFKCNPKGERKLWKGNLSKRERSIGNKIEILCKTCNKPFTGWKNLECSTCRNKATRKNRKEKALDILGNRCKICGYDKCKSALVFHHMNKDEKDFSFADSWGLAWEELQKEIQKCVLLCCRCHAEIHEGLTSLP